MALTECNLRHVTKEIKGILIATFIWMQCGTRNSRPHWRVHGVTPHIKLNRLYHTQQEAK
jgi:hypothetical protein